MMNHLLDGTTAYQNLLLPTEGKFIFSHGEFKTLSQMRHALQPTALKMLYQKWVSLMAYKTLGVVEFNLFGFQCKGRSLSGTIRGDRYIHYEFVLDAGHGMKMRFDNINRFGSNSNSYQYVCSATSEDAVDHILSNLSVVL